MATGPLQTGPAGTVRAVELTVSNRTIVRIFAIVAGLAGLLYLLWTVRSTAVLVFLAIFLAVALGPAVDWFVRRRVPRALAILLVYLGIALSIFGVGLLIVPPVVNGVDDLSRDIPTYVHDLRDSKTFRKYDDKYGITDKLTEQAKKLPSRLGDAATALQSVTVGVFGAIVQLVTVLTLTFFLLLDGAKVLAFLHRARGPNASDRLERVLAEIYRSTSGYVVGNLLISLCAGITTWVVLTILGVPFAAPLAVLMAFLDLIPLVGATIGGVAIGLVTLFHNFPTATIIWVIVLIVYQQVENNVVQPMVYRRTVNVHPVLVIIAILIGSSLLGVLGALLAIPIAAGIQVVIRELWAIREERRAPPSLEDGAATGPATGPEPAAGR